jgi:hypothetical protein
MLKKFRSFFQAQSLDVWNTDENGQLDFVISVWPSTNLWFVPQFRWWRKK